MNIEEIDKWLDNEYGVSYTKLEELHDFVVEQDLKHREEKDKEIERLNNIINEVREYNEQIIKDTKDFYRPTEDIIYSGDSLIDIATQNIEILDKGE